MSFIESQSERRRGSPSTEISDRLRGDLHVAIEAAKSVTELARRAIPTLTTTAQEGSWRYEVRETSTPQKKQSTSTSAMIAFALAVLGGDLGEERIAPGRHGERAPGIDPKKPWLEERQEPLWTGPARQLANDSATPLESQTFGQDDPFTLYWAHRLVEGLVSARGEPEALLRSLHEKEVRLVEHLARPREPVLRFLDGEGHEDANRAPPHVWPLVRIVHLANALEIAPGAEVCDYFVERVLIQLSYSEITDSLFDVGELVFAFEGALACDERACSRSLVERVAAVVAASQRLNPSLRALSPFRVTGAGSVNTPVSIEVATALLRCCWILDRADSGYALFAHLHGLFDRYLDWLRSLLAGREGCRVGRVDHVIHRLALGARVLERADHPHLVHQPGRSLPGQLSSHDRSARGGLVASVRPLQRPDP